MKTLSLPHGEMQLPVYLPDATYGAVRSLDARDLETVGIQAVVMNTFHLMQKPGVTTVKALGGLHTMSGWRRPIITDSGGFQAYSMIRENSKYGTLTDKGINFRNEVGDKIVFTPEKSIQLQMSFGADIVICLDDCTHVDDDLDTQRASVTRTVAWARRCRDEFDKLAASRAKRPLLFGVIQGGGSLELRRQCAEQLLEIGFDGFGFGGWPLDAKGNLLTEIVQFTRDLVPREIPMHALGIGHPQSVIDTFKMGYEIFDCALPTRDARHGRLYIGDALSDWRMLYIADDKHIKTHTPLDAECDCPTCQTYSVGYLHHLYKIKETLYYRLATLHNLRFMARLMRALTE